MRFARLCLTAVFCRSACADQLAGRVISIADGDTLTVLDHLQVQHKIRLVGIDAPEKRQPFGSGSKSSLASLCFGKTATVDWEKRDRYQRIVGKVWCDNQDAGLAQIGKGMAWWYEAYAKEQEATDQHLYSQAQMRARSERVGLWQDGNPTPPWTWRRALKHAGR